MNLYDWDAAFACSGEKLNEILAGQFKKTPASLAYDGDGVTLQADFDPWRIVAGGAEKKLRMELPFKQGTISNPLLGSIKLDGVVAVIEVTLAFVSNAKAGTNDLRFDLRTVAAKSGDETDGSVFVVVADRDGILKKLDPTGAAESTLHDHLAQCLIANRDKLIYLFTSLNLAPAGDASWLALKHAEYVFLTGPEGKIGYLAVLGVVTDRDTGKLQRKVDPSLVDYKHDACAAFAPAVFLEHVIKPNLPSSYPGSHADDFVVSGSSLIFSGPVAIAHGHPAVLACATVDHWGTGYRPSLGALTISIAAEQLKTVAAGSFDITGLANSYVTFTTHTAATFGYDAATGKISFVPAGSPSHDYNKHIPWYLYVASLPVLPFLGLLVGAIVVGIVDGVTEAVTTGVAQKVTGGAGQNLALANWSSEAVKWPGMDKWTVQEAGLSDAFYLRCTLEA